MISLDMVSKKSNVHQSGRECDSNVQIDFVAVIMKRFAMTDDRLS